MGTLDKELFDLLILTNGPGEVTTWVRPVVAELQDRRVPTRISVVLSPCSHATGREASVAADIPGVNRVLPAERFWDFLLWGRVPDRWDWHAKGIVLFLGGDQAFAVAIARRLGYRSIVYAEWDARWYRRIDRFAAMSPKVVESVPANYQHKVEVVGDLMAEAQRGLLGRSKLPFSEPGTELVGLLPGSKAAKLQQGVPLMLAIAAEIQQRRPQTRFVVPVAPTVSLADLSGWADRGQNPVLPLAGDRSAILVEPPGELPYLEAEGGLRIVLWQTFPAWDVLAQCRLCLTTVGANTAELGALAVPMLVLLPSLQLDAMRAWDGLPGLLANLPLVGSGLAKAMNWVVLQILLRQKRLFAWPNKWAGKEIVPELLGRLDPKAVADRALDWLENPDKLAAVRSDLQAVRGPSGAASKIARMVAEELERT